MIYNSFNFLVIIPLLFFGYYVIPVRDQRVRNWFLLFVSYLLYLNWKPVYALILMGVTVTTYMTARLMERAKRRRALAMTGGIISILPLLFFKYLDFINETICDVLSIMGMRVELYGLNWVIPVGISFYTFQALGYLMDVYYKRIEPEKDFWTYALFVSFFPSIVAGPINKASLLLPQLKNLRPYFDYSKAVEGLKLILWGMFMKVAVADRLGLFVDSVLPNYMRYTGTTCLVACIFYTIQIYADFGGYSLMAIGVGKTFGLELTENFRRPYFAVSVTDFWHRWHMSLSAWLKDYVYIPLGGSRCSKPRNYWNIFITFLVSGIWHGANWTYIVWGILHGFAQIVEKMFGFQKCGYGVYGRIIKILITFIFINLTFIFFRMPTMSDVWGVLGRIFDCTLPLKIEIRSVPNLALQLMAIAVLFIKDFKDEFFPGRVDFFNNKITLVRWASYCIILTIIVLFGVFGDQFIYTRF